MCGKCCTTYDRLDTHRNSRACKKKAEKNGTVYVSEGHQPVMCQICDYSVMKMNFPTHLLSKGHLERVRMLEDPVFGCILCNKIFEGTRPRTALRRHCMESKKHIQLAKRPENRARYTAMCRKYFGRTLGPLGVGTVLTV